ncbi:hypothetical protein C1646_684264 [Rhizophagus diaphanus]|nr:hypothetical protein C1646_684264 [Rhizophagus diaphanus] [Rhizophagus sp. MUCL 43196]
MGNVSSSLDEHPTLYVRNSNRFHVTEIAVSNSAHDPYITFPITQNGITAVPNTLDLLEFIQDPNVQTINTNKFLLKLTKDKKLKLKFKFNIGETDGNKADVRGLTFINVASEKELARILTVEFNDDPNLHKHPNVTLIGNYESDGMIKLEKEWTWEWLPPHNTDEIHRGWRNHCCFAEYDANDNNFTLLASFTFWVADIPRMLSHRASKSSESVDGIPFFSGTSSLLPSSQSTPWSFRSVRPSSPDNVYLPVPGMSSYTSGTASSVSSGGRRSSDDLMYQHEPEDGPLFRATLTAYEKKTGSLKHHIKRVLKAASGSQEMLLECHKTEDIFLSTLKAAAAAHPQAFQPVLDSYLEEASKKIATSKLNLANQMSVLLIEPLRKLYENDIKVADSKKKEFEDESRDYYQFLSKYLSLKVDSAKEKKKLESDTKYQSKRKTFELKRFDYYAFMQDLHGGRKDQEILYHLTNFAEKQFAFFQQTALNIQSLKPGLDKLAVDVDEATKEIHLMRKEREERRRTLETRTTTVNPFTSENFGDIDSNIGNSSNTSDNTSDNAENTAASPVGSPNIPQNKFKGIRDLEQHDSESASNAGRKKEGFLFATSRVTHHGTVDPISKTSWHKYWCVLAGGQLCEYSNWKKQFATHNEPINLRFATVREARGTERRFCFEVVTPQYRRIYQATSAEDMSSWMTVISNAIESLLNGTSSCRNLDQVMTQDSNGTGAGKLFAKKPIQRRGTLPSLSDRRKVDMKKGQISSVSEEASKNNKLEVNENEKPVKILESVKGADVSNLSCADCGARKTEWCSINLGIILCIECSGIHRSLGTHISKIRSLTLDTNSYTPDLINLIKSIGNARSNAIWEATLEQRQTGQQNGTLAIPPPKIEEPPPVPPKNDDATTPVTDSDWEDLINMISPSNRGSSLSPSPSPSPTPSLTSMPAPPVKKYKGMTKPNSSDSRDTKQKFITAKYVDRAFVDFSLVDDDKSATDILFDAVKSNDLSLAMQAIALKADVNAARRFEVADDHGLKTPLLLALLHIDPAKVTNDEGKLLFPMAELLLQNGAYVENVLFDNLEDMLGVTTTTPTVRNSPKSVGAWAAEIVSDMKKSGKTVFDVVQASGNNAAIRYLTPKVLARGTPPNVGASSSVTTTSTGGLVGGAVVEKKHSSNLGRSLSITVKNVIS